MYFLRLDDASEYMNIVNWDKIENLLDKYEIKPIVGIIPNNKDENLVKKYNSTPEFWVRVNSWQSKKWTIALHGYTHVCSSKSGGINPINLRSEFAGLNLETQRSKISNALKIFHDHNIIIKLFFAPSHTFDLNTLEALRLESNIRIINDTIANDIYKMGDFYFIPQQAGRVRKLPFKTTTFCYHPNTMNEQDFKELERFFLIYKNRFGSFEDLNFKDRKLNFYDIFLKKTYFSFRRIRIFKGCANER